MGIDVISLDRLLAPSSIASLVWNLPSSAQYSLVAVYANGTTGNSPAINVLLKDAPVISSSVTLVPLITPPVIAP